MRNLDITVFEPGDIIATMSSGGRIQAFTVGSNGDLHQGPRLIEEGHEYEEGQPIDTLELTVRTYNVLKREGIDTIDQLLAFYDREGREGFHMLRNMGDRGVTEVMHHVRYFKGGYVRNLSTDSPSGQ